ncbi:MULTISPECIES: DUF2235 domain-containing protein [Alphaproteobacteria]|uniref:T6SS Phospholipase effector Tle1-like catalytic domain-containing protein n=2 Tax=Alphaproteobacteria TaxID=28211 RepID=A0A512HEJ4_9HYPH|nr:MULTISPECIES: DUF2235 domain-containing protein [Alphaproteobacteria]GEO83881.1 hypothetical protein RNA01_08130 [Ciceribacter naphthalenivorans]GLR21241.1 hypothetical protein GCM10007920_10270 [Ciceribacter naphthalenivorans]GLT04097.1 hypothetical protein GCM10007926_10270 [Sphingomonas psychrolutea]
MGKNIVLLFDGTSNEIAADRTNVLRLFGTLRRTDNQIVYYDPGVGTFGADNAWSRVWRKTVEVWGLATGWGIDANVKQAYRFIVENYQAAARDKDGKKIGEDDRIYLFGFSRGAYTARILAGFIHSLGLIRPQQLNLLDYAYRTYKGISDHKPAADSSDGGDDDGGSAFADMRIYERTLKGYRPAIELLGLFDTVASVIESGKVGLKLKTHAFTHRNPSVRAVRHAVAIDERRTMYRAEVWTPDQSFWGSPFPPSKDRPVVPQDSKEVWFTGVHGDVGGGSPESESALIKVPLAWMIEETKAMGLDYSTRTVNEIVLGKNAKKSYVKPDAMARAHDSMNLAWRVVELLPRRVPSSSWRHGGKSGGIYLPLSDPRYIPPGALIHQSVVDRLHGTPADGPYRPTNLPESYRIEPWGSLAGTSAALSANGEN